MAGFIALHLRFDEPHREIDVLRRAMNASAFTPKAIGAFGHTDFSNERTCRGFLSGWGLESFGSRSDMLAGRSLATYSASEGNDSYLASLATKIRNTKISKSKVSVRDLSPFEEKDGDYPVSFLASPALGLPPMDACDAWAKQCERPLFSLYGTFHISVRDPETRNFRNAFRWCYDEYPDNTSLPALLPFIVLKAQTHCNEPCFTYVQIFSSSLVWLRNGNALRGGVGPGEADENLLGLANLVDCFVNNGSVALRHAQLNVEGLAFQAEWKRIYEVLSLIIPHACWSENL